MKSSKLFAIVLTVVSISAFAQNAPLPGVKVAIAPETKVGDWVLRRKASGIETRIVVKEVRQNGTMVVMLGTQSSLFTMGWNPINSYGAKTGSYVSYSPAFPLLSFPLWPGKTWQTTVGWSSGSYSGSMSVKAIVGDWTTLKIGGKEIDAIALRYQYDDGTKNQCWYASSVPYSAAKCESTDSMYAYSVDDFGTSEKVSEAR